MNLYRVCMGNCQKVRNVRLSLGYFSVARQQNCVMHDKEYFARNEEIFVKDNISSKQHMQLDYSCSEKFAERTISFTSHRK